jgi:hypothetical protein
MPARNGDVNVEHVLECHDVFRMLGERAQAHAGVRDHDVRAAVPGSEIARRSGDGAGIPHVEWIETAGRGKRGDETFELGLPARDEAERCAGGGVAARERRADAARCAGDDDARRHRWGATCCGSGGRA